VLGNVAGVNGGGILNGASVVNLPPSTMTITDSKVSFNRAPHGGGIANFGTLTFAGQFPTVGGNQATTGGGVLQLVSSPVAGSVTGGCPPTLGLGVPPSTTTTGFVTYDPPNTPDDYAGFNC